MLFWMRVNLGQMMFEKPIPFSMRYVFILASIILTFYVLIILQSIIMPLIAALIVSILLKPVCIFIERFRIPRIISTLMTILLMLLLLGIFTYFIVLQIKQINTDINGITENVNAALDKIKNWAAAKFKIIQTDQQNYIKDASNTLIKNSISFVQSTLSNTLQFIVGFLIFIIGVFFFLYYRDFLILFLFKSIKPQHHDHLENILQTTQKVIRKYLVGFVTVLIIVAFLNSIGLLLLNIKHAVFFGTLGSVLLIIPYIGITIGALIPFLFALATSSTLWQPFAVILVFWFVQFLEGNFITPYIVGKQVSVNPFAVLLVLFLSGTFFGLMGVILSIPALAILKIVFDEIQPLKPLGFLLARPDKRLISD